MSSHARAIVINTASVNHSTFHQNHRLQCPIFWRGFPHRHGWDEVKYKSLKTEEPLPPYWGGSLFGWALPCIVLR